MDWKRTRRGDQTWIPAGRRSVAVDDAGTGPAVMDCPGGVVVVEPWITPDGWIGDGTDTVDFAEQDDAKLLRVTSSRRDGDETFLRIHYVRASRGTIEFEDERHRLGLFSRERYVEAFTSAGSRRAGKTPVCEGVA